MMDNSFWTQTLPSINASLNATSAVCLACGFVAARCKKFEVHRRLMLTALTTSAVFLVGYLVRMFLTGTHRFPEVGWLKTAYLTLLFSHMFLAVFVLPLIGRAVWFAYRQEFGRHRQVVRIAWPIWMYVSVTGVVVYWMLYHLAPTLKA